MNKKLLIIIGGIILTIALGLIIFLPIYYQNKLIKDLMVKSQNFAIKWQTFTDESSDEYLNSIKPYLSDELISQYQRDALELRKMKEGYEGTVDSKFKASRVEAKETKKEPYKFEVSGEKTSKALATKEKIVVRLLWAAEGKTWKVQEASLIKE